MRAIASSVRRACRRLYSIDGRVNAKMFGRNPSQIKDVYATVSGDDVDLDRQKKSNSLSCRRELLISEEHDRILCRRRTMAHRTLRTGDFRVLRCLRIVQSRSLIGPPKAVSRPAPDCR